MTIEIPNYKVPSWNTLYAGKHWNNRKGMADEAHGLIKKHLPRGCKPFTKPVKIEVHAFYKTKRRHDPDNVCSKILIDGLVGEILIDDSSEYVESVTTKVSIGQPSNYVRISVA